MLKQKIACCLILFLVAVVCGVEVAAAFDKPAEPPGNSGNTPGDGNTPPGQDKDKPPKGGNGGEVGGDSADDAQAPDTGDNLSAKAKARIEWLTSKEEIAAALRDVGEAIVEFRSADELRNVVPWLTPSLAPFLSVTPEVFDEISPTATEPYELTLALASGQPLSATLGGTLHIRQSGEGGELGRTYARPLGISVQQVSGDESDDETEDDAGDAGDGHQPGIAVAGSADYEGGAIAPLEIISIFGLGIGPADLFGAEFDEDGQLSDYVADVQVLFDGVTAPILAASENQINVVVPYTVAGKSEVEIIVTYKDQVSLSVVVPVTDASPAIYTMNGLGHGQVAALNQDGTLNSPQNPAAPGSIVTFFGTGVGLWKDGFTDAATVVAADNLPEPKKPVKVSIGGIEATTNYVGGSPGMVCAVVQFNVTVPADVEPGPDVPIQIWSGNHPSKATVTLAIEAPADLSGN